MPFADQLPKAVKRDAGRMRASTVPAHIRADGVTVAAEQREYIRKRLGAKLGKFADSIERASVRVRDVNGPKGGIDTSCRIKVVLSGLPSVVFEARNRSVTAAIDDAISGVERAVRRHVQRRWTKPLSPRAPERRGSVRPTRRAAPAP